MKKIVNSILKRAATRRPISRNYCFPGRKTIITALILLSPAVLFAGPVMVMPVQKVVHDTCVVAGKTAKITFPVQNTGDGDLAITKVITDCGCAAAYYDRIIPQGGRGRIDLAINTKGLTGWIKKRAIVKTNDPQKKTLLIEAEFEVVSPDSDG